MTAPRYGVGGLNATEWCGGVNAWTSECKKNPYKPGFHFCPACGLSVKIPQSGHRVGLVPAHKRIIPR